jgi:hypothetical protein
VSLTETTAVRERIAAGGDDAAMPDDAQQQADAGEANKVFSSRLMRVSFAGLGLVRDGEGDDGAARHVLGDRHRRAVAVEQLQPLADVREAGAGAGGRRLAEAEAGVGDGDRELAVDDLGAHGQRAALGLRLEARA